MALTDDAVAIWKAAVAAVDSETLIRNHVSCDADQLQIGDRTIPTASLKHIEVVGAGKAGSGMARGIERALRSRPSHISLSGWVNVPEDCVEDLPNIHLHAARPAGINEPTQAGIDGTREILNKVRSLSPDDLCIVLISGGGSALLPAPTAGISLESKLNVTRLLATAGATIDELNCVRSQISDVKAGGLAAACKAGQLIALIISDVIGDPLHVIASGPTVASTATPEQALKVLHKYDPDTTKTPADVLKVLNRRATQSGTRPSPTCRITNEILGSNHVAVAAAAAEAGRLGYSVVDMGSANCGPAADAGRHLFNQLSSLRKQGTHNPTCILAGGETTVELAQTNLPRKGGRNQELVLAAVAAHPSPDAWNGIALLSGGTDGEDGPTPAAGAIADSTLLQQMQQKQINPDDYLAINNSYPFFKQLNGLLLTGPTHTNVMDIQVGLATPAT